MPSCNESASRQQLPCRSWCEEVRASCLGNGSWPEVLSCDIFPHSDCYNIAELTTEDTGIQCFHGSGTNYRGEVSRSRSGAECLRWDIDENKYYITQYPWANLEENYCRNPDPLRRWFMPWCYTRDGPEPCDVVPCNDRGCLDPGKPEFGQRRPLLNFYPLGEWITFICDKGYIVQDDSLLNRAQCVSNGTGLIGRWSPSGVPNCAVDHHARLVNDLLSPDVYNKALPPSRFSRLDFQAYIVNVVNLTWKDRRLIWHTGDYGGITDISIAASLLWMPSLILKTNADTQYGGFPEVELRVDNTGAVHWTVETLTTTTCELDPYLFPQDNMTCAICWTAGENYQMGCSQPMKTDDPNFLTCTNTTEPIKYGEWGGHVTLSADNRDACLVIELQRDPRYHLATTISPCIILVILMIITFLLPIEKGDRISFSVTVMLSMVVSLVVVTGFLPVNGTLPFIAILIIVSMGMMGIFTLTTLLVLSIHNKKGTLPAWARTLFLRYLAIAVFKGDLTKNLNDDNDDAFGSVASDGVYKKKKGRFGSYVNEAFEQHSPKSPSMKMKPNFEAGAAMSHLEASINRLAVSIDALAQATSGCKDDDDEMTDYALLAHVLDRLFLLLYVVGIIIAVPCTLYFGRI
ncbi:PREDICTED: neuronal acetylcholine receptor subunit beta-4-like [Branchiostoma belcheri]|uniref:Neuronal acetylcholine receptor subunit beta-4-like n=1 Tax=Branchiostoma belcheri TaxID=7741 RepID=A0A6P4XQE5_BRABE|nr:PREDICTED: neuronal acetylcholine receptor subunit beta-4-like [Branchiostoma belcheri]